MTHKIKIDRISWLILSGALTLAILVIALFVTGKFTDAPTIVMGVMAGFLFIAFLNRIRGKNGQTKPPYNKYEITLWALIVGLLLVATAVLYLIHNFMVFIILMFAVIVLLLIAWAYRVDRKAEWEKEQQALQHSTL